MSKPLLEESTNSSVGTKRYMTLIFNNDFTPQDVVLLVLMRATGCSSEEAYMEMWEAEQYGKAAVHFADENECRRIAGIIESVGVKTEVRPEWDD